MKRCGVCGKKRSPYFLNNKPVCLACDELLIDIEIECDEEPVQNSKEKKTTLFRSDSKAKESSN